MLPDEHEIVVLWTGETKSQLRYKFSYIATAFRTKKNTKFKMKELRRVPMMKKIEH